MAIAKHDTPKPSLHLLLSERDLLLQQIEDGGGEFSAEHEIRLTELDARIMEKADSVGYVYTRLTKDADLFSERAKVLHQRAEVRRHMAERLKERVLTHLLERNLTKVEGEDYTLRVGETDAVTLTGETLPPAFTRTKVETDKMALKAALKQGVAVKGALLEKRFYLAIK